MVEPTFLYQGTLKSAYFPLKIGKSYGIYSSGTFAFIKIRISTVLIISNTNILGMLDSFSSVLLRNL